jgi:hypothetical protein
MVFLSTFKATTTRPDPACRRILAESESTPPCMCTCRRRMGVSTQMSVCICLCACVCACVYVCVHVRSSGKPYFGAVPSLVAHYVVLAKGCKQCYWVLYTSSTTEKKVTSEMSAGKKLAADTSETKTLPTGHYRTWLLLDLPAHDLKSPLVQTFRLHAQFNFPTRLTADSTDMEKWKS